MVSASGCGRHSSNLCQVHAQRKAPVVEVTRSSSTLPPWVGSGVTYILGCDKIKGAPWPLLAGDEMQ